MFLVCVVYMWFELADDKRKKMVSLGKGILTLYIDLLTRQLPIACGPLLLRRSESLVLARSTLSLSKLRFVGLGHQ